MYLLQLHCHNVLKMIKKKDAPRGRTQRTHPKHKITGCMPKKSIFLYELVLNANCIRQKFFTSLSNYATFDTLFIFESRFSF